MTRWYVTAATLKDAPAIPPELDGAETFDSPAEAWEFADYMQKTTDAEGESKSITWQVYSLRPVGRVTVREQGGQQ